MKYYSTRDDSLRLTASAAILQGISSEGGLFVPEEFPKIELSELKGLTYPALAAKILGLYLTDYSAEFLAHATETCYGTAFGEEVAKTVKVHEGLYSLELWHGPTCAFKDYALQLMPHLLVEAKRIQKDESRTLILVATSGDTGKAALEGYKNLPGIEIAVFYPESGTSETQRLQMVTQEGNNVHVYAVKGNFDDAQTGVKRVFTNKEFAAELAQKNCHLTSANSINWGRLAPQIVYYFASYLSLVAQGEIKEGEPVDFCVPTGNFGDILAGYYAKRMGLPVGRLVCASNSNRILTDFGESGVYDAAREFYKTSSPSMDILVSSNLERLLLHKSQDAQFVAKLMTSLAGEEKKYEIPEELKQSILEDFAFGACDEAACFAKLAETYKSHSYLADPHTAVALEVAATQQGSAPCVVLSTANPYKFSAAVLKALGESAEPSDMANIAALHALTGAAVPAPLAELSHKTARFGETIRPEEILRVARSL